MKSVHKITLGGMVTALSVVIMLLTGLAPMAEFALPAIAGVLLIPIVAELGKGRAFLIYLAVSLLSAMLAPVKESALYYAAVLGLYPIIKSFCEGRRSRVFEWALKFLFFNLAAGLTVAAACLVFSFPSYEKLPDMAGWVFAAGAAALNAVFLVYDLALSWLVSSYYGYFRPRYFSHFFK